MTNPTPDRTGELCFRDLGDDRSRCHELLRRASGLDASWVCTAGHRWDANMQRLEDATYPTPDPFPGIPDTVPEDWSNPGRAVSRRRRVAPVDTWPMIRVSFNLLPWSWRLRPWWFNEWPGTLAFEWLFVKIEWMAQDRVCDWFHEIYRPDGDYWVDP